MKHFEPREKKKVPFRDSVFRIQHLCVRVALQQTRADLIVCAFKVCIVLFVEFSPFSCKFHRRRIQKVTFHGTKEKIPEYQV